MKRRNDRIDTADRMFVEITTKPLDPAKLTGLVATDDSGAVSFFVGTVRNHFDGRDVIALEYVCFVPMAEKVLSQICGEIIRGFDVNRVAVQHRYGKLEIGEASVVIAVSSAHRDAAFKACRRIIETIKVRLPVWKKEYFADGSTWKEGQPVKI